MKKLLFVLLIGLTVMSVTACGGSDKEPFIPEQPEQPEEPAPDASGRYLVVYCSRTSNTERIAHEIQAILDCDILEVEPQIPYEKDYNAMLSRAQEELAAIRIGDYPPIRTAVEGFEQYDMVFVGYPVWYGSMATPMQTFLHMHSSKLAGKRIALFASSGGSGISTSVSEAKALCPNVIVAEETLLLTSLLQVGNRVNTWLEQLGVNREENADDTAMKVNMTIGSRTITATMEDNAAAGDFLSRLPLEVTLQDYNDITEKIFYPSPALTITGVTGGCAPVPGDITIYAPWGNVAIFCKSWPQSRDLIKIGHIDGNGIRLLAIAGDVQVKFEKQ